MRAALGSPQAITEVLDASKKIALNRYEKTVFDADGWQIMLSKHKVCAAVSIFPGFKHELHEPCLLCLRIRPKQSIVCHVVLTREQSS